MSAEFIKIRGGSFSDVTTKSGEAIVVQIPKSRPALIADSQEILPHLFRRVLELLAAQPSEEYALMA